MKTSIEAIIEKFLESNSNFRNSLKDEEALKSHLIRNNPFVIRDGKLVSPGNNTVHDVGTWVNSHSRAFLKTTGNFGYLAKYRDTRSENEKVNNAAETKQMLETWLQKKGYSFVSDEPVRIWKDQLSKSMIFASDGDTGFVLSTLVNGVPTKFFKPEELFPLIGQYVDPEKTRLNELRRNSKITEEAFKLSGLLSTDLSDQRKAANFEEVENLLKKEYFAQPTKKSLPNISSDDLINDLQKEIAFSWKLPVDPKAWTLSEKTSLKAIAEDAITEAQTKAIAPIQKYVSERPANFFKNVVETFNGLPNEINE